MVLAFLAAAGCASETVYREVKVSDADVASFTSCRPAALRCDYERLLRKGQRNEVLNQMEIGLCALDMGQYEAAEESFEDALLGIETVYAGNEAAVKAREQWYEVGSVDFKGHPYERAMAYFYRGLLYLAEGDYQNARACFKSGVIQDAFVEEEQHRCDFALLIFLEGWASQCDGDYQMADEAYAEVKKWRPHFTPPPRDHNTLLIAETGRSPRKVSDGVGHFQLKFFRGRNFDETAARFRLGGRMLCAEPMEDIYYQAATRGGRPIDHMLEDRVVYRRQAEAAGTALTDVSTGLMIIAPVFDSGSGVAAGVAGGLGVLGVANLAAAQNARPQADFRYWTNLPDAVHVLTCRSDARDGAPFSVQFFDSSGRELRELARTRTLRSGDGRFALGWARSRSAHDELEAALNNAMITKGR